MVHGFDSSTQKVEAGKSLYIRVGLPVFLGIGI